MSNFKVLFRHEFFSATSYALAVEAEEAIAVNEEERAAAKAVDSCDEDGAPPSKKKKVSVFITTTFCSSLQQRTNPFRVQCDDKESTPSEECLGPPHNKGKEGTENSKQSRQEKSFRIETFLVCFETLELIFLSALKL